MPFDRRRAARRDSRTARVSALALTLALAVACTNSPAAPRVLPADAPRLPFQTVRSMLEDSQGNYWFGSWDEGVCRFDGRRLTRFTAKDGLCDDQIRSIHEDRNGVIWFEGGFGISGFDGARLITPTARNYEARHAWRLDAHDLWFKEDGGGGATAVEAQPGVYRYDGKVFTYLEYPVAAGPSQLTAYATTGVAKGRGRVWFATYAAVFGYDGKTFTVLDDKSVGLGENEGRMHVRSVLEDRKGNLWIGNNGIGVLCYDGHQVRRFTQEEGLGKQGPHGNRTSPLPGDVTDGSPTLHRVFAIGEDRDGNLWFGTVESGAWRYDGTTLRNYTAADGLTSKDIFCIYTDRHGDLWLTGHGVFRFNGTSFDRVH